MLLLYLATATLPTPPPLISTHTGFVMARQRDETKEFMQAFKLAKQGRFAEAATIYGPLAAQGNNLAQFHLGNICYLGALGQPDYSCAFEQFSKAAHAGFDEGQFALGTLLEKGLGTPKDLAAAFHWYMLAAKQERMPEAQTAVGLAYYNGHGVARDDAEALSWYKKAAARQHAAAQFNVGMAYKDGRGVRQNYKEAIYYLNAAAHQKFARAEVELGRIYLYGLGVPIDQQKGVGWYQRAAERGVAKAQLGLGRVYSTGQGAAIDHVQAYKWYSLVLMGKDISRSDSTNATTFRNNAAAMLTPDQLARAQALVRDWKPVIE